MRLSAPSPCCCSWHINVNSVSSVCSHLVRHRGTPLPPSQRGLNPPGLLAEVLAAVAVPAPAPRARAALLGSSESTRTNGRPPLGQSSSPFHDHNKERMCTHITPTFTARQGAHFWRWYVHRLPPRLQLRYFQVQVVCDSAPPSRVDMLA